MRVRDVYNTDANLITPCAQFDYGETEDYDITVIEATTCQKPTTLGATNMTDVSAILTWGNRCFQTDSWDVHISLAGSGIPTGIPSNPTVTSGLLASGLMPLTSYEFYVRANCGENGSSEWAGPYVFTTRPPRITNDECNAAVVLTAGGNFEQYAVTASNIEASTSTDTRVPLCAAAGFGGDVWFSVIVPVDGNVTVEVRPYPGSFVTDTGMSAYIGTCGALTVLGCDDESGVGSFSMMGLSGLTPGSTIYVRVWEYANDTVGTFMVSAWNTTLTTTDFNTSEFKAYPNPVKDFLTVSYSKTVTHTEIFNMLGQRVFVDSTAFQKNTLDLSGLSKGTYIMKVYSGTESKSVKIIKE